MPLTSANLRCIMSWASSVANAGGFGSRTEGPDSLDYTAVGLSLTVFPQVWAGDVTIASGGHVDFDVTNPPAASPAVAAGQNLNSETVSFTKLHSLFLDGNNGSVSVTVNSTNPLTNIFGGAGDATIPCGGLLAMAHGDGTDTTGWTVDSTHKTFRLNNTGGGNATVSVGMLGKA